MRVWTDTGASALIFVLVTSAAGCGEAEPVAIERDPDAALAVCVEQADCENGQICAEGACHTLCGEDADPSCGTVTLTITTDGGHITLDYRIHR
jgi:hypothetical protein